MTFGVGLDLAQIEAVGEGVVTGGDGGHTYEKRQGKHGENGSVLVALKQEGKAFGLAWKSHSRSAGWQFTIS